jgi:hypothetical protein
LTSKNCHYAKPAFIDPHVPFPFGCPTIIIPVEAFDFATTATAPDPPVGIVSVRPPPFATYNISPAVYEEVCYN